MCRSCWTVTALCTIRGTSPAIWRTAFLSFRRCSAARQGAASPAPQSLVGHRLGNGGARLIAADFILCLAPEDREYYAVRGGRIRPHPRRILRDRPRWLDHFATVIAPLERTLSEQPFFAGVSPNYADYLLFSVFQYMRSVAQPSSSQRAPRCGAGATASPWPLTGWETAIRPTQRTR